jgi:predicted outer membrane repeat protein
VIIDAGWNGPALIADGVDDTAVVIGLHLFRGASDFGGGIQCRGGSPHVLRCKFEACKSWSGGGGAQCSDGAAPVFESCLFTNNLAETGNGGALAAYGCSPVLRDCEFSDNHSDGDAGAVYLSDGTVDITDCWFLRNSADHYGGALLIGGCDGELDQCVIRSNTAGNGGGGALIEWGPVRLRNTTIDLNRAFTRPGGGLMAMGYDVIALHDCIVEGNQAPSGAGIHGGSDLLLVDTRVENNTADDSGGGLGMAGGQHLEALRSSIRFNFGSYPRDCFIPENSSASLHCCDVELNHWFDASVAWIDLVNCTVGNADASWGEVKTLYR